MDQWPSLSTWPRCERLAVTERDEDDAGYLTFRELQEVVEGVQVWLLNQPAASLARIRELRLDLWAEPEGEGSRRFVSAPFIALLARLLPNLQVRAWGIASGQLHTPWGFQGWLPALP